MAYRYHGHAKTDPRNPSAYGISDRSGFQHNLRDLVWEMEWRGPRLMRTGFLVSKRDLDVPQQQLRPRILPPDPVPIPNPRPEQYAFEVGLQGFTLLTIDPPAFPSATPYFFYPKAYVLDQVTQVSGITPPPLSDYSGIIAASQVSQPMIPAFNTRTYMLIFNPVDLPIAVSFTVAAFNLTTSIVVSTGQALLWSSTQNVDISINPVSVAGFQVGQIYYAWASLGTTGLVNDGGVLQLDDTTGYPTDPTGLLPGVVWNNGLTVAVVPGATPNPAIPDFFFGAVSAAELLFYGGSNLPTSPPTVGSLQLWNNGGVVCVA